MKSLTLLFIGGAAALLVGQNGSSLLQGHVKALQDAPSLTASLAIQPIGGTPATLKLALSKPNLLKIEGEEGWTLFDGKTIYVYSRKSNTWTESAFSEEALKEAFGRAELYAWRAFFDKDAFKGIVGAKLGAKRNLKGTPTDELGITLENGTAMLFVDPKLGFARGFTYKSGESDLLVTSSDIQVGKTPLEASAFAFQAPEGAKKEEAKAADEPSFANVQAIFSRGCLPCHSPAVRSGGYNLTTYQGVVQGVVPGSPADSRVVQVISGPSPTMPKMRPPLSAKEIEVIAKWVESGAKR